MIKLSLLYNMLNLNLVQFGILYELLVLSVDESMAPYFGCHGAKMLIRGNSFCFVYFT